MTLNPDLLRSSFELVIERAPNLTARFYDNLFAMYPQLAPMFGRNSRATQEEMLASALSSVLDHLENTSWLESTLRALGAKHVGYGVTDEMYDMVGAALLRTLAEVAGDAWNDVLAHQWTLAFGAIAGLMQAGAADVLTRAS